MPDSGRTAARLHAAAPTHPDTSARLARRWFRQDLAILVEELADIRYTVRWLLGHAPDHPDADRWRSVDAAAAAALAAMTEAMAVSAETPPPVGA